MNAAVLFSLSLLILPPGVTLGVRLSAVPREPDARFLLGPDPCRCTSSESIGESHVSGNCPVNPPTACYSYQTQRPNGSTATTNGNCYYPPACPGAATTCHFQGWEVRFVLAAGNCPASCCNNGPSHCVDIYSGSTAVGSVCAGGTSGWVDVTNGNLACGVGPQSHVVSLICPPTGGVVYEVTATYRCNDCTTPH